MFVFQVPCAPRRQFPLNSFTLIDTGMKMKNDTIKETRKAITWHKSIKFPTPIFQLLAPFYFRFQNVNISIGIPSRFFICDVRKMSDQTETIEADASNPGNPGSSDAEFVNYLQLISRTISLEWNALSISSNGTENKAAFGFCLHHRSCFGNSRCCKNY